MKNFLEYAKENRIDIPETLQQCLPSTGQEAKDTIRERQKLLNRHRNVLTKMEKKKAALEKDQEKWNSWVNSMKQEIQQQKEKHEETQLRLRQELEELEQEEKKLRENEEDQEMEELEIAKEDPYSTLERCLETASDGAQHTRQNVAIAEIQQKLEAEYEQRFMQERLRMQQTFEELLVQSKSTEVINLEELDTESKQPGGVVRVATAPFGVQRTSKTSQVSSPYGTRKMETQVNPKQVPENGENG